MTTHAHAQSVVKQLVLSNHLDVCCLQGKQGKKMVFNACVLEANSLTISYQKKLIHSVKQ